MRLTLRGRLPSGDPALQLLLEGGPAANRVFPGGHFKSAEALARRLAHLDGGRPGRALPKAAQALLQSENAFASLHPSQEANLDLAGKHGTVFLLTGQQPGLLGGPVLWLYKALTCAALAEDCTRRLGRPVIPVFWVAGDDSDLHECNHLELLEDLPEGLPSVLRLAFPEADRPLPVGSRQVEAGALEALLSDLARVWKPDTLQSIRDWHPRQGSLADAFLRLAQGRLGPRGVLFLNGNSPAVRAAARPVLERAVRAWHPLNAALARGTAALRAAGIEPQVPIREGVVHAFLLRDGERQRLFAEPPARLYTADRPGEDLFPRLASLELSHDVFTRLLVAEAALPVLGHVLGPAELRYFGQMAPAFLEETGDMPLVHPRMSVAVAPAGAERAFAARGVDLASAAALKPSALRERLQEQAWKGHPAAGALPASPPAAWIEELRKAHARHFPDPGPLDRLERSLKGSWRRYLRSLERMAYAQASAGEDGASGGPGLFRSLRWLGNGAGQDRHLNLHSLLDVLGRGGLDGLMGLLDAEDAAEPGTRLITFTEGSRG